MRENESICHDRTQFIRSPVRLSVDTAKLADDIHSIDVLIQARGLVPTSHHWLQYALEMHLSRWKLARNPLQPINLEFHHRETMAISSNNDEVEEYENEYGDPVMDESDKNTHVRKRRAAKWSPDYDLYGQWAEEYYAEYETAELNAAKVSVSKGDVLDQFARKAAANKTVEEIQKEIEWEIKKKGLLQMGLVIGTWIIGIIIILCVIKIIVKKYFFKLFCDFCDVYRFREKTAHFVNTYEPGVYEHKNGELEYYKPTEEEFEALKETRKLMYSVA
ncbi:uncharacterized protein NPIL_659261 [Nephila pilipes]|uniref:Uncharacterized protein n=1 Tax=Nephila pilipes TaxID=299642 RepID=A0A8X6UGP4_NEPPI|nr:uncharacterized protein NPIL_659261 [Nephila pilipes]